MVIPSVEDGQLGQIRSHMLPLVVASLLKSQGKGWIRPSRLMSAKVNDRTLQAVSQAYGLDIGEVSYDTGSLSIISCDPELMDQLLRNFHTSQLPPWPQERRDLVVILDGSSVICSAMDIGLPTDSSCIPDGWNVKQSGSVLLRFTLTAILIGVMTLMLYLVI